MPRIFFFDTASLERVLGTVKIALDNLTNMVMTMAGELDGLKAAVLKNTTVTDSAITLLTGLKQELDAAIAGGDPAALKALSDNLGAETQKLADAVAANTPAA